MVLVIDCSFFDVQLTGNGSTDKKLAKVHIHVMSFKDMFNDFM